MDLRDRLLHWAAPRVCASCREDIAPPLSGPLCGFIAVLILTDHREFDYDRILDTASLVVDTRNAAGRSLTPRATLVRL